MRTSAALVCLILSIASRAEAPAARPQPPADGGNGGPPPQQPVVMQPRPGAEARAFAAQHGLRRNDPCPCGSGQKFKKCCFKEDEASPEASSPTA